MAATKKTTRRTAAAKTVTPKARKGAAKSQASKAKSTRKGARSSSA